jgi:type IV secretory pathway TrbD component
MRRTRGETLRRFFREAVVRAVLDFADFADVDFEDLLAVDFVVWEVAGLELSVCAGVALWSVCRTRARDDAHTDPQAIPVTRIRTEVRE